jgi:glycosyltransferase involved in cell wall biosynthesis
LAGSLEDVVEVKKVKKMIKDLNLDDFVFILGPVKDVSEILSQTDIGVLSSISEGLPVSLLEYGLAELPVVCTDVGQCKEVLGNGKFGWIVPSNSPKALAEALKQALLNMPQARLKGMALKNHINECYGANGFLAKYFELINRIKREKITLKAQNK